MHYSWIHIIFGSSLIASLLFPFEIALALGLLCSLFTAYIWYSISGNKAGSGGIGVALFFAIPGTIVSAIIGIIALVKFAML